MAADVADIVVAEIEWIRGARPRVHRGRRAGADDRPRLTASLLESAQESLPSPVTEPEVEPASEGVVEPAVEPAGEPAVETATDDAEPVALPTAVPPAVPEVVIVDDELGRDAWDDLPSEGPVHDEADHASGLATVVAASATAVSSKKKRRRARRKKGGHADEAPVPAVTTPSVVSAHGRAAHRRGTERASRCVSARRVWPRCGGGARGGCAAFAVAAGSRSARVDTPRRPRREAGWRRAADGWGRGGGDRVDGRAHRRLDDRRGERRRVHVERRRRGRRRPCVRSPRLLWRRWDPDRSPTPGPCRPTWCRRSLQSSRHRKGYGRSSRRSALSACPTSRTSSRGRDARPSPRWPTARVRHRRDHAADVGRRAHRWRHPRRRTRRAA